MSGGHFDYKVWHIREMADTIQYDIALALKPKPEKVYEDYWTIYEMDSYGSYHLYPRLGMTFDSAEEAEAYLLRCERFEEAKPEYGERFFKDDKTFQTKDTNMDRTPDSELIPIIYAIHHCVYDHYPYDVDVLELTDETVEIMKTTYRQLRIAEIYVQQLDLVMSGDESEENFQKVIHKEHQTFEADFQKIDWTALDNEDNY